MGETSGKSNKVDLRNNLKKVEKKEFTLDDFDKKEEMDKVGVSSSFPTHFLSTLIRTMSLSGALGE